MGGVNQKVMCWLAGRLRGQAHIESPVLLGTCGHWRSLWERACSRWLCVRRRVFCGCTYPLLRSRPLRVPPLRRVTLEKPQSNQRALAPDIRCLAVARHPLAPVLLRGPAAIGHPWPGAANPASMPGCPLRRTSTRPHEGARRSRSKAKARRPTGRP